MKKRKFSERVLQNYYMIFCGFFIALSCATFVLTNLSYLIKAYWLIPSPIVMGVAATLAFTLKNYYKNEVLIKIVYYSYIAFILFFVIITFLLSLPSANHLLSDDNYQKIFENSFIHFVLVTLSFFPLLLIIFSKIKLFFNYLLAISYLVLINYFFYFSQSDLVNCFLLNSFVTIGCGVILLYPINTAIKFLFEKMENKLIPEEDIVYDINTTTKKISTYNFYAIQVCVCTVILITSHTIAYKIIGFNGITMAASGILFPLTFLIGDAVAEVYGFKHNRTLIWTVLCSQIIFVLTLYSWTMLPELIKISSNVAYHESFKNIPRQILAASLSVGAAFFVNGILISKLRLNMQGKRFWLRTIISGAAGKTTLCIINYFILFLGVYSIAQILSIIGITWIIKVAFAIIGAPFVVIFANYLKNKEKIAYNSNTIEKYQIFSLDLH